MVNMFKMEVYRMFKTVSLYIIWAVLTAVIIFTTFLIKDEYDDYVAQEAPANEEMSAMTPENVNIGIVVTLPTDVEEKVTVFDLLFANLQGKVIALFMVIFVVIFSTADINSGYIKNIGGQVEHRSKIICARAAALFLYVLLTMAVYVIVQIISNGICFGYVCWGDLRQSFVYLALQILLHFAMVLICMTIAVVIHNNVFSMAIALSLCMNLMVIVYGVLDKAVQHLGISGFNIIKYVVTGQIALLPMQPAGSEIVRAVCIGAGFILGAIGLGCAVFEKRDI